MIKDLQTGSAGGILACGQMSVGERQPDHFYTVLDAAKRVSAPPPSPGHDPQLDALVYDETAAAPCAWETK
jgi:hypothetical protein